MDDVQFGSVKNTMKILYKFLIRWQIAFVIIFIIFGILLLCYLYFLKNIGYYRVTLLGGVVMAVVLGGVTTIRMIIYFLERFSKKIRPHEEFDPENNYLDFFIFLLKFFGMNAIAFCYVVAILSISVFMFNK